MKISLNWLKQYVHLDQPPEIIAEWLTGCGLEVESLEVFQSVKGGLKGVVIGEVLRCEKHPNADHLSLTLADTGQAEPLNIVCGAPNVAVGQKVAIATLGTTLYFGNKELTLQKTKIRGEISEGMICAEDELGLGPSHSGILVLDPSAKTGTPASAYFNIEEDIVFTIGLTPNRPDAASHIGVARDLVAVINNFGRSEPALTDRRALKIPDISAFSSDSKTKSIDVVVEDAIACPRYSGITISGIVVADSPAWLKNRLTAIGLRPINNIVDIANYILMECGQPLHAFDADKIAGEKVLVKKYPGGTPFKTLDDIERKLTAQDLMICNTREPMCIAGVFGGLNSGVNSGTKNVFLESAYFSPTGIRKTARFHGLQTDASFRFERGADPEITIYALKRAALLIREIAGGEIFSDIVDVYPVPIPSKSIDLSYENLDRLIGKKINRQVVKDILYDLGIQETGVAVVSPGICVNVPAFKTDVTREVDLIEEVIRIYGYNNIEILPEIRSSLSFSRKPDPDKIENLVSDYLAGNGFQEVINNSLTRSAYYSENEIFSPDRCVNILNPISRDLDVMRQTLLYGGLETILYNYNRKAENLKLFEFGNVYRKAFPEEKGNFLNAWHEEQHLALFLTGLTETENWNTQAKSIGFFELKGYIQAVLLKIGLDVNNLKIRDYQSPLLSEGLCFSAADKELILCGIISKPSLQYFDIKKEVLYAEFNWAKIQSLIPLNDLQYKELPRFPEVRRDLALLIDKSVTFDQIEAVAYQAEKRLLKKVGLFDVYEGEKIAEEKKSYAVSFILQDEAKTLTDQDIEKVMDRLIKMLTEKLNAQIR